MESVTIVTETCFSSQLVHHPQFYVCNCVIKRNIPIATRVPRSTHFKAQAIPFGHRYVDRLTETVKQKKDQEEKMLASQVAMQEKRKASIEEAKQLKPKEEIIIKHTRELQKQVKHQNDGLPLWGVNFIY